MPRPVFPVVRLPYDQPDRVARVLDAVRREFEAASRLRPVPTATARSATVVADVGQSSSHTTAAVMTAHVQQQTTCSRQPAGSTEMTPPHPTTGAADDQSVDQVTVGVRDCTLTPKVRPDILVTAGGAPARNAYLVDERHLTSNDADGFCCHDGGGPYLLVPPVNITAEISRPPLTTPMQYYTATS